MGALRLSVVRGRPFGAAGWVRETARTLGLTNTLRDPGRPPKPTPANGAGGSRNQ